MIFDKISEKYKNYFVVNKFKQTILLTDCNINHITNNQYVQCTCISFKIKYFILFRKTNIFCAMYE